ncbi:MAG: acyl-CoA thioesterase [Phycisphaerae bacterium]
MLRIIGPMNGGPPSCEIEIRVRYAEVDAMGYLHHAQYFVYFEMGRTELLRRCGLAYREMEHAGLFYVVAKLECRFRAPVHYDDVVTLTTTTTRLTPARVEHDYRLVRAGRLCTEAHSVLICVGRDGRPTPLPDEWFDRMSTGPVGAH